MLTLTEAEIEQVVWERDKFKKQIEEIHSELDWWGVPRKASDHPDSTFSITGRIEWLRENIPDLFGTMEKANANYKRWSEYPTAKE